MSVLYGQTDVSFINLSDKNGLAVILNPAPEHRAGAGAFPGLLARTYE